MPQYIYTFKYDTHNESLCQLEARQLFKQEATNKMLFSDCEIDPSISPFIKNRFEILFKFDSYDALLAKIKAQNICIDRFKAEYLVLHGDDTKYQDRLGKLKDIGYCIEGDPDYENPIRIYSICKHDDEWYFGILEKHNTEWFKHKNKPREFSSAINMDIAKALVSIATRGDKNLSLLDAGCGVGTVMLEACISGFKVEGVDIHWKACVATRENLAHYNYEAKVVRADIKDLNTQYDSAIVDVPYNIYTHTDDEVTLSLIESTVNLASRLIIVSTANIESLINKAGLQLLDHCTVEKKGKKFARQIWVCEKTETVAL